MLEIYTSYVYRINLIITIAWKLFTTRFSVHEYVFTKRNLYSTSSRMSHKNFRIKRTKSNKNKY